MKTISKDTMVSRMFADLPFSYVRLAKDDTIRIESNGHTYEIRPHGQVIACFDGLNYRECTHPYFRNFYMIKKAEVK